MGHEDKSIRDMDNELFPKKHWDTLFTPDGLACFAPTPGTVGFSPMLEVFTLDEVGEIVAVLHMLMVEGFDDHATRVHIMEQLGKTWAEKGWQVVAIRLATEAWMRHFSAKEAEEQGDRSIASYPDKEEVLMVAGLTMGGRAAIATAPLKRGDDGTLSGCGVWRVHRSGDGVYGLQTNLIDNAMRAYANAFLALREKRRGKK